MEDLRQLQLQLRSVEPLTTAEMNHLADCKQRIADSLAELNATMLALEQEPLPSKKPKQAKAAVRLRESRRQQAHCKHEALLARVAAEQPPYQQLQERQNARCILLARQAALLNELSAAGSQLNPTATAHTAAAAAGAGAVRATAGAALDTGTLAGPAGDGYSREQLADQGGTPASWRADLAMGLGGPKRAAEGAALGGPPVQKRLALDSRGVAGLACDAPLGSILQQDLDWDNAAATVPVVGELLSAFGRRSAASDKAVFEEQVRKLQGCALQQVQLLDTLAEHTTDPDERSRYRAAQVQQLSQIVAQNNARWELANSENVLGSFAEAVDLHLSGTPAAQLLVRGMAELSDAQRAAMVQTLSISSAAASGSGGGGLQQHHLSAPVQTGDSVRSCYHCGGPHAFADCDTLGQLQQTNPAAWWAATSRCRQAASRRRRR